MTVENAFSEIYIRKLLLVSISDTPARQIVGRQFDADAVADENAYAIFAHLAGNLCEHDMLRVIELHLEKRVGLLVYNQAFSGNQIIFSQSISPYFFIGLCRSRQMPARASCICRAFIVR